MNALNETPTITARRSSISSAALMAFSRKGYYATTVADVAVASGYSAAYVFRLFDDKLGLFIAALELCYGRIQQALADAAAIATDPSPVAMIDAMGGAYADLIADRDLLMLQVHAQSASEIPQVRDAVREGYASVVELVRDRSGAEDTQIQLFIARGQLCHLIVTAGLDEIDAPWAMALTQGMRHPERDEGARG